MKQVCCFALVAAPVTALVTIALTAVPVAALAGPMGFRDSTMAMGDLGPNWREVWVNHAITARDAFGGGALWMRSDDGARRRTFGEATYTRLMHRINLPNSQANAWFVLGAGAVSGNDFDGQRAMASPGVQLDYETTRVAVSTAGRLYRARGLNHDFASARAGFSFYEVDYDETQPWLVVEARRMRGLSEKIEITPMLRLIHSRYFLEFGVNNSRDVRFNFMYIF